MFKQVGGFRESFEEASVMLIGVERLKASVASLEYYLLGPAGRCTHNEPLT